MTIEEFEQASEIYRKYDEIEKTSSKESKKQGKKSL